MISVEIIPGSAAADRATEIVERKGKGHPDSICDAAAEAVSLALIAAYQDKFGTILHHNIDKCLLAAGAADIRFSGGTVNKPMEFIIGDRATAFWRGRSIPVQEIAVAAVREWVGANLRCVDPQRDLVCRSLLAPGSAELAGIFDRRKGAYLANDTSAAIGFYPLSATETVVLETERYLNSPSFKERYPESGEDVKVLGLRRRDFLELTVAMPLLAAYVHSEEEYFRRKEAIHWQIATFLEAQPGFGHSALHFNALDERERGLQGIYLSLLGTSAENADSGQVGRGNRVNGIISLNRPLGTEATAGKNPVSHVGKIYNVLSHQLARRIFEQIQGIKEVYVMLLSRIGQPVDRPVLAAAQILPEIGLELQDVHRPVEDIIASSLSEVETFCARLARGEFPVC